MTSPDDVAVVASEDPGPAHDIRRSVFVREQGIAEGVEFDDRDDEARHFVVSVNDEPVGTARVRLIDGETAKVERVAVRRDHRENDVGRRVMTAAHEYARDADRSRAVVHAQARVDEFYESLGYETVGDVDDESGIPHVKMVREL